MVARFGHVDDDHAQVHVDLRGRETDAGRRIHGFGHVAHELPNAVVDLAHGLGDAVKAWVWIAEDDQYGHREISTVRKIVQASLLAASMH